MEKEIIKVKYFYHEIVADIMPPSSVPEVLCLHGAGTSNRTIYYSLRKLLLENKISSCSLDFVGHGDTGGELGVSSLESRTEQSKVIIEQAKVLKPLVIIAGSMAAYNAIKLTEIYPVKLLILSAPAVYRTDAYKINFGEDFSARIRDQRSWDSTDAWGIMSKYKGKIVILKAGKDEVIPPEIIQKLYDSSSQAIYREIITFPNSPHTIMSNYLPEHPEDLKMVIDKIITLLK